MKQYVFLSLLFVFGSSMFGQDTTPPVLESFSFSPENFTTGEDNLIVSFSLSASDDESGIDDISVSFSSPGIGGNNSSTFRNIKQNTVTVDGSIDFGKNVKEGTYYATISITDRDKNSTTLSGQQLVDLGFPAILEVISQQDVTPPVITGFSFTPDVIDLKSDNTTLSFSLSATDESNINRMEVSFSPAYGGGSKTERINNVGVNTFTFKGTIDFGNTREVEWRASITVTDVEGNTTELSTNDLKDLGFPYLLTTISSDDNLPPILTEFSLGSDSLLIIDNYALAQFSLAAEDDESGISDIEITFAPSGNGGDKKLRLKNINALKYSTSETIEFGKNDEGLWSISISLSDAERNIANYSSEDLASMGFTSQLSLEFSNDNSAPIINTFFITPDVLDISIGPPEINFTLSITGETNGIDEVEINFDPAGSGGGEFLKYKKINATSFSISDFVSFSKNAPLGLWNVSILVKDFNNNSFEFNSANLAELGLSHQVILEKNYFLTLNYPNGGEIFFSGNDVDILWDYQGVRVVRLEYSTDNGTTWNTIAGNINANRKNYKWPIQFTTTEETLLKIIDKDHPEVFDLTDDTFSITSVTGIEEMTFLPTEDNLYQNFPNPFNPATQIYYSLAEAGNVSINVYNSLGQLVDELVNEYQSPGGYSIKFNAGNLVSGIYFYRIVTNRFTTMKKMLLVK